MGSFELDEENKCIYCYERPEDNGGWWECSVTDREINLLKKNEVSMYDLMNDGRRCW